MSFLCLALGIIAVCLSALFPDTSSLFSYAINDDNNENETSVSSGTIIDDNPNAKSDADTEKKDMPCNAVAILGPTYIGPRGCPLPCPSDSAQQIPQGCPKNNDKSDKFLENKGTKQVPDRPTMTTPKTPNLIRIAQDLVMQSQVLIRNSFVQNLVRINQSRIKRNMILAILMVVLMQRYPILLKDTSINLTWDQSFTLTILIKDTKTDLAYV
jgi:hypothetical protein